VRAQSEEANLIVVEVVHAKSEDTETANLKEL
jgi:hypothetical protein